MRLQHTPYRIFVQPFLNERLNISGRLDVPATVANPVSALLLALLFIYQSL
jgi:hypothetical protein